MANPELKDDEVLIDDGSEEAVDIEIEEEASPEGEGDKPTADAAPKVEAKAKEPEQETEDQARERRRQERHERKEKQRQAKERNQAELAYLREAHAKLAREVQELRTKHTSSETSAQLQKARADMAVVESVIAKAIEDGDGAKHVEALRVRDAIAARIFQLSGRHAEQPQQQRPQQQRPQQQQLAPAVVEHFKKFRDNHPSYEKDPDYTRAVKALDAAVYEDGYDPATQDYWDELSERIERTLGKSGVSAAQTAAAKPAAKGGPQVGSGRSQVMPGRQTYTLSAERLAAMRDAGIDTSDPATLKKYAAIYQKYDRENAQA